RVSGSTAPPAERGSSASRVGAAPRAAPRWRGTPRRARRARSGSSAWWRWLGAGWSCSCLPSRRDSASSRACWPTRLRAPSSSSSPRERSTEMSMVEVRVRRGGPGAARVEMLLVPVAEGQLRAALGKLDRRVRAPLARRARTAGFGGKAEETLVHHGEAAVALLGLGPVPVGLDAWRRAGARARQEAERERARRVGAYLGDAAAARSRASSGSAGRAPARAGA